MIQEPQLRSPTRPARRRASHSMEAVLTEAILLLDEAGEPALTFRALAARLGGGVGSIYWYVQSKDELLDRAADYALESVVADTEQFVHEDDPIDGLRGIAIALFTAAAARPWLSSYFLRNTGFQPNSLLLFERVGGQVLRLQLTARQSFDAASAVIGFVIGLAADMSQEPPAEVAAGAMTREQYMDDVVNQWRHLDQAQFPFLHSILDVFRVHDDVEQFRAGLDLLLDGLRRQAERARDERAHPGARPDGRVSTAGG